jgi:DNA-binding HxlR family transcriptional regulator
MYKTPKAAGLAEQCSVDFAFQRIGGKYKARILWHLFHGTLRYGELKRQLPDSTPKMLTQALRELEADRLIKRRVYHEVPPRVEYSLDDTGRELMPAIELLSGWGKGQMMRLNIPVMDYRT